MKSGIELRSLLSRAADALENPYGFSARDIRFIIEDLRREEALSLQSEERNDSYLDKELDWNE